MGFGRKHGGWAVTHLDGSCTVLKTCVMLFRTVQEALALGHYMKQMAWP
jgi:hypothetical protein